MYLEEIRSLVIRTAAPASASSKRKVTGPGANGAKKAKTTAKKAKTTAKKAKTAQSGSKTPHQIYLDRQEAFLNVHKDIQGRILIRGISSSGKNSDPSKFTKKQMDSLRFVMITKNRDKQLEAMGKLVLGDQYGDSFMWFNTSFSYDVLDSWQFLKMRISRMKPAQKFDILLAYTHTLQEHSTWMHDNEGGMGVLVQGLATAWRNLLKKSDAAIGWDVEYTKPGTLELLGQFKREVESMDDCMEMGKFKFVS